MARIKNDFLAALAMAVVFVVVMLGLEASVEFYARWTAAYAQAINDWVNQL